MSNIWYLSPSTHAMRIGADGNGVEKKQMYLLVEELVRHLDRAGVSFHVSDDGGSGNVIQNTSPCGQQKATAPACLLEMDFHDSSVGAAFLTKRRSEIAEAIARVIIEADGKEFVPITNGECVDQCIKWGLFNTNGSWQEPLTREDAAILAVRLKNLIEKGVN